MTKEFISLTESLRREEVSKCKKEGKDSKTLRPLTRSRRRGEKTRDIGKSPAFEVEFKDGEG